MATASSSNAPNYGTLSDAGPSTASNPHPKRTRTYLLCTPSIPEQEAYRYPPPSPSGTPVACPPFSRPAIPMPGNLTLPNRTDGLMHPWIIHSSFESIIKLAGLINLLLGGLVGWGCCWYDPRGWVLPATWAVVWGWYARGWKTTLALVCFEWYLRWSDDE
ncbi:Protein of unknown function [Pyronema omphalodes CBS 100304]|uniref:Uncharacterized protein n=1 Tax=Pyronema omphalodes (strain CBS 100304) TaxID=1076935 RepID=U4KVB0_PYROM|nr:Protein of unknown function [Pyronema omphalodes CBS 100304]